MGVSKIFLSFLLSFIGGIFTASFFNIPELLIYEFFILGILYIGISFVQKNFLFKKAILVFAVCLIIFGLGIVRYQIVDKNFENAELKRFNDTSDIVEVLGTIMKEPDIRDSNTKLTIDVEELNNVEMEGRVLITVENDFFYYYGDKLKIRGLLKTPKVFEDFNYQEYLKKDNILAVIYRPQIELVSRNQRSSLYSKILFLKNKLRKPLYQILSSPQSSILGAILLGDKQRISSQWKEKLNIAGVRHITAVSGMHIVVLSAILISLFIGLGLCRRRALLVTLIALWFYILIIGFQPSAIRAGIMASFLLLSERIGRLSTSSRTMIFTGALMLLIKPFLLRYDVGFQLSFLAVMGIIYLGPIFKNWLRFIPEEKFIGLRSILAMTFSAQIFALPILIYNFGYFSLVSPFTNVLIIPILPYIMITGFLFVIFSFTCPPLAWVFSLPVYFLLSYLTLIVSFFSKISWAGLTFQISWFYLLIFYFILIYFVYRVSKKQTNRLIPFK